MQWKPWCGFDIDHVRLVNVMTQTPNTRNRKGRLVGHYVKHDIDVVRYIDYIIVLCTFGTFIRLNFTVSFLYMLVGI